MYVDSPSFGCCRREYKGRLRCYYRDGQVPRRNRSARLWQSVWMVTLSLAARMTRRHRSLTALLSHVVATLALSGRKGPARKHACDSGTRHPHQHDAQQQGCSNSGHSDHYSFSSCNFENNRSVIPVTHSREARDRASVLLVSSYCCALS